MSGRTIRSAGDRAILIDLDGHAEVAAVTLALTEDPIDGVLEVLPAAQTVMVQIDPDRLDRLTLRDRIDEAQPDSTAKQAGDLVEIDVLYDGEDLAEVADLAGISAAEVIERHSRAVYTAAFAGFAPGFVYLVDGDPLLNVPRRATPRTRIPAGAVAIAGEFSGVYPRSSPGGWQLLGRTSRPMWDVDRERPALVRPGDRVRFRPVDCLVENGESPSAASVVTAGLLVEETRFPILVQDRGRPGLAASGVGSAGAMDRVAARLANDLVGNSPDAAVLEVLAGGVRLAAVDRVVVAVTGAPVAVTVERASGRLRSFHDQRPIGLDAGDSLEIGSPVGGLRNVIAVQGGVDVPSVLGSRSYDSLAGLGPAPLITGAAVPVGGAPAGFVGASVPWLRLPAAVRTVGVRLGPRDDWFLPEAIELLENATWTISDQTDRVGARLLGPELPRARGGELPSEGVATGSIQVPSSGVPLVFLADHPVTGGYPVIAVVRDEELDSLAQAPPGTRIRFRVS